MNRIGFVLLMVMVGLTGCKKKEPAAPETAQEKAASAQLQRVEEQLKTIAGRVEAIGQQGDQTRQRLEAMEKRLDRLSRIESVPVDIRLPKAKPPKAAPTEVKRPVVKTTVAKAEIKPPEEPPAKIQPVDPIPTKEAAPGPEEEAGGGANSADGGAVVAPQVNIVPTEGEFKLVNIKFASKVDRESRQPLDPKGEFSLADERVYAWMVFSNKSDEKTAASVTWYRGERKVNTVPLNIGKKASHWRTWSYARLSKRGLGMWKVEVTDGAGILMGSATFNVTE